jgi:hypothetical protein
LFELYSNAVPLLLKKKDNSIKCIFPDSIEETANKIRDEIILRDNRIFKFYEDYPKGSRIESLYRYHKGSPFIAFKDSINELNKACDKMVKTDLNFLKSTPIVPKEYKHRRFDVEGTEFIIKRKTRHRFRGSLNGYSGTICDVQQSVNGLIGVSIDNEIRYFCDNDLIVMKTYEDWESTSIDIDKISSKIKLGKDEFGFKIHLRGLYKNYFSEFLGD